MVYNCTFSWTINKNKNIIKYKRVITQKQIIKHAYCIFILIFFNKINIK